MGGRECAGWFLVGDLGLDWRMGAEWFESVLVDYEPTANWFNWTYRCLPAIARKGIPGEQLQGLEILKWGTQHDPDATYIKRWIPVLTRLPCTVAREPWRLGLRGTPSLDEDLICEEALKQVVNMGFDVETARRALSRACGDVEAAVGLLLGGPADIEDESEDLARAMALSLQDSGTRP